MIDQYFTDQVKIVSRSTDVWGQETVTEKTCLARCDKIDLLSRQDGNDIGASWMIFLPRAAVVGPSDYIIIEKLRGEDTGDAERRRIVEVHRAGGFSSSHIEVLCA